jgi:hypothetical protein
LDPAHRQQLKSRLGLSGLDLVADPNCQFQTPGAASVIVYSTPLWIIGKLRSYSAGISNQN